MFNPLQNSSVNAAQGIISGAVGVNSQGQLTSAQAYSNAVVSGSAIYRDDWMAPRLRIEVDKVSNGYVIAVGSERLIAKDLEELQQHFIAQVVSKLVLDESK